MDALAEQDFQFTARTPRPPLDRFVELLWYAKGQVPYAEERILPNGRPVLLINLGDAFELGSSRSRGNSETKQTAWLCGVQSAFLTNRPLGRTEMAGATLRPAALPALTGLPAADFANQTPDLHCIWPSGADRLRVQLWEARTQSRRLDLLERYLTRRLAEAAENSEICAAIALLGNGESVSVAGAALALHRSRKHLAALFRNHVGVPPSTFARITRFNRLLDTLGRMPALSLAEAAFNCGYYDQPHLNRDFTEFAGLSPTAYLAQRERLLGPKAERQESRNFVPLR